MTVSFFYLLFVLMCVYERLMEMSRLFRRTDRRNCFRNPIRNTVSSVMLSPLSFCIMGLM